MRDLREVREEIDRLSTRRTELWEELGRGADPAVKAEIAEVEARVAALWEEQRQVRARIRFGERDQILTRARTEERLERSAA